MDRDQDLIQLQTLALAGQQLRMPISNLMQLTDALQANFREETTEKEIVSQINRGLYQMFRIVSNMTDAERYASNCLTNLQTTHATNYLKEVFAGAEAMLEGTAVTLRYEGPSKNVFTLIDRAQLERAILNMLSNALKFAPKDSVINAKAEVYDKQLRISVENQGEPIPPHIQSSIFHRYQREPSVEDSRYGLGLGMTVIRSVAAIHGGTVLVDHSNGTRVTMTIAIRRQIPSELRSPVLHVSDYAGGWDKALVELADTLPVSKYKK